MGELAHQYALALREYCARPTEAVLHQAYQLGRRAVKQGLGVLDLASVHQRAVVSARFARLPPERSAQLAERAAEFLSETLAPFELTQRGFEELSATLSDVNRGLQNRLEAALQDVETAHDQLLEQRRLETLKNDFIAMVSHEVRTPLTSIHGALNLLKNGLGGELTAQGAQLLDIAYRNSERVVRLVSDMLDLEKIEAGTMTFNVRPLDLRALLQQAIDANQAYATRLGVTLKLGRVTRGERVSADSDRLMQVLANLLSNAAKFSPPDEPVVVEACRRGRMIRVSVRDRGPGVPEEFRSRVFQRFAQASNARDRGGSGLGLSISKAIVEHLGGRIDFESVPGGGSTFYFDLPEWRGERGLPLGPRLHADA